MGKDISIIIPAYNEAKRIVPTVKVVDHYLKDSGKSYEIIVVDDGSHDDTFSVLSDLSRHHKDLIIKRNEINRGKGCAVRNGVLSSNGKLILVSDADLSTPIEEVEKLLIWISRGFDITIGSRALKGSEIVVRQHRHREWMGRIFNILVRLFVLRGFKDTQCGFKIFKGDAARDVFKRSRIDGFSFDVEILYIARKLNYKIKEVSVRWANSNDSKVSIIKEPIKMIMELFRIRQSMKY